MQIEKNAWDQWYICHCGDYRDGGCGSPKICAECGCSESFKLRRARRIFEIRWFCPDKFVGFEYWSGCSEKKND